MTLLLHEASRKQLNAALDSGSHAVLLRGIKGVGLATIATKKTSPMYVVKPELLTKTSSIPQISVDQVRELYTVARGKTSSLQTILIDDADTMTLPAQNSLLKLLEEPIENIRFVLTSHNPEKLLPTLHSRVQAVEVLPVDTKMTAGILSAVDSELKQRQLQFIAGDLPAELYRLVHDEAYYQKVASQAALARKMVEASIYERLVLVFREKLDRVAAMQLIEYMLNFICRDARTSSLSRADKLIDAYEAIKQNGNVRLHLMQAMVY